VFPPAALRTALHLYAITPDALPDEVAVSDFSASLAAAAAAAIDGGVTAIQYRDKSNRTKEERATIARRLALLCGERDVLFIINDDAELAAACGADGVHLGPHDASVHDVKARYGDRLIVGASAGDPGRALELVRAGADYLGVGAIYDAHGTKADA
jgi:thiamine-phosphate pyrophosphorylase